VKLGKTETPIVALAADTEARIAKMQSKVSEHVTVLRDANLTLVGPLGIRDQGGNPAGGDVFRTAHIVVDRGGKVISTSFGENYRIR